MKVPFRGFLVELFPATPLFSFREAVKLKMKVGKYAAFFTK